MSPRLPLEDLGETKRERTLLRRLGVVAAAVVIGATFGVKAYAWASTRIGGVESELHAHLAEVAVTRPQMDEYVREERAARCASARNLYRLCMAARIDCEPVDARCRP